MHVFGPETHMTAIVAMALGKRPVPRSQVPEQQTSSLIPKVCVCVCVCVCACVCVCVRASVWSVCIHNYV